MNQTTESNPWIELSIAVRISTTIFESPLSRQEVAAHFPVSPKRLSHWEATGEIRESDLNELAVLTERPISWFHEPLTVCGDKVHAVRLYLQMSQAMFADKVGVSRAAITQLERHETQTVNGKTHQKISDVSGIRAEWFINGKPDLPSSAASSSLASLTSEQRKAANLFASLNPDNREIVVTLMEKLSLSETAAGTLSP